MQKQINGLEISNILYEELNRYLWQHQEAIPRIVDISIGNDFGTQMYVKMKEKTMTEKTMLDFISVHFNEVTEEELEQYITNLNNDNTINGIMIQLPLPRNLQRKKQKILDMISPEKDIDGLTTISQEKLWADKNTFVPCTPKGIEQLLKAYNIKLAEKKMAIINRSNIVGKPLAKLMSKNKAIPIICHSKTENLASVTQKCDIVVAALNKKEYITEEFIKEDAIVIDVGVHKNKEGKIVGDVDFSRVYPKASLITPSTGAVGPMTICMLAYNTVKSLYGEEVEQVLEQGIKKAQKRI